MPIFLYVREAVSAQATSAESGPGILAGVLTGTAYRAAVRIMFVSALLGAPPQRDARGRQCIFPQKSLSIRHREIFREPARFSDRRTPKIAIPASHRPGS